MVETLICVYDVTKSYISEVERGRHPPAALIQRCEEELGFEIVHVMAA